MAKYKESSHIFETQGEAWRDRKTCLEMMKGRAGIIPRMVSGYLPTTLGCRFEGQVSLALRGSL